MNPELAWMAAIFWIGRKPRCEVSLNAAAQICLSKARMLWSETVGHQMVDEHGTPTAPVINYVGRPGPDLVPEEWAVVDGKGWMMRDGFGINAAAWPWIDRHSDDGRNTGRRKANDEGRACGDSAHHPDCSGVWRAGGFASAPDLRCLGLHDVWLNR
jgi:hypothetical protein